MLWIALPLLLVQVPQAPPRDAPPPPKAGTGVIRGRVTTADTGQPMRRAHVMLSGPPITRVVPTADGGMMRSGIASGPRPVLTNSDGRYEFTGLVPGSYQVRAMVYGYARGAYLSGAYGATTGGMMDSGARIELAEGQRVQANIVLQRGGVIVGRVLDEFGDPVTRASVQAARINAGGGIQQTGSGFQTDDLGRFRLFGLESGDYVVFAEVRNMGGPPLEGPSEGFITTFFPSALNEREASRVRVTAGTESGEVEVRMIRTRTFRITGTVVDSQGQPLIRPQVMLVRPVLGGGSSGSGGSVEAGGKFTMRDVVPGEYRLVVRPSMDGSEQKTTRREYAAMPLTVNGDIDDVMLITQPGATISGQLVFAEGAPANLSPNVRVGARPSDRLRMGPSRDSAVDADLKFTLTDIFGPQVVYVSGLMPPYALKAVMLGAADITDSGAELKPDQRLQIVVTARASSLEGTVAADSGALPPNTMVLLLPEDKASWKTGAQRLRMTGAGKDGKFVFQGLIAGRYYAIAIPRDRFHMGSELTPEHFAPLVREATTVVMGEDEKRIVDLRLVKDFPER